MVIQKKNSWAAVFITLACLCWATDTFVRYPTSLALNSKVIVLLEHVLGLILILPWLLVKHRDDILQVKKKHIPLILDRGSLLPGSALGSLSLYEKHWIHTLLDPTLFQMLQPMLVVVLAYFFLKERHSGLFFNVRFGSF